MGFLDGFITLSETTDAMKNLKFEVLDRELALGLYRWPTAWRMTWTGSQGPDVLTLKQLTRTSVGNWAIGGFSMDIVRVDLRSAGIQQKLRSSGADHVEHFSTGHAPLLTVVRGGRCCGHGGRNASFYKLNLALP